MAALKFADSHSMVAFLEKPAKSDGFKEIIDFLNAHTINDLRLEDAEGIECIPNVTIFEELTRMRLVQVFLDNQFGDMSTYDEIYVTPSHTRKVFVSMKRVGKGFSRNITPLFPTIMVQAQEELGEGLVGPTNPQHTPTIIQPSTSKPQKKQPRRKQRKDTEELMDLCTNLQDRVLALETTKTNQALEIKSSKRRVKRLEKKQRSRTHKLKRLYKGDEVIANVVATTVGDTTTTTNVEVTLAQALIEIKTSKPKAKGIVFKEPSESTTTTTPTPIVSSQQLSQVKDKAKFNKEERVAREKEEVNATLIAQWNDIQDKVETDYELAERLQQEEQEELTIEEKSKLTELIEEGLKTTETEQQESSIKRAGDELEHEKAKKQKIDDDQEEAEMKKLMEIVFDEEEIAVDVVPLATKPPSIVDWKVIKEGKIGYYQIIRANGSAKRYSSFLQMLRDFDREDLETLWKWVKAKHGDTRPEEGYERVLWGDLKVMFEPNVKDIVWRSL
ncbi:hypothetical protein Tco_0778268 [Tanacetum coccineum]